MPRVWLIAVAPTFVLAGLIAGLVSAASLEAQLDGLREPKPPGNRAAGLEIWRHRGATGPEEYPGIELDVRWLPGQGLVISHDPVEPGGAAPSLKAALALELWPRSLWLDFKQLDLTTAQAAAPDLATLLTQLRLAGRCWVEATDLEALSHLRDAVPGVKAVAHAGPWQRLRPLPGYLALLEGLLAHRITAVSLPHEAVTEAVATRLEPLRLMVFTVNDVVERKRLQQLGVEVILTDRLPPR